MGRYLNNLKREIVRLFLRPILRYAFDTHVCLGNAGTLTLGERASVQNALFNLSSGSIVIGDRTIFGHNVMVLTGTHLFKNGKRVSLDSNLDDGSYGGGRHEVPVSGRDVIIGEGCFIGSGAIIVGPISIGPHCIVASGTVVASDIPPHSFVAGPKGSVRKNLLS